MGFEINNESKNLNEAITKDYLIEIEKYETKASFKIMHIKTGRHAFNGTINISNNKFFELTIENEIYLIANFGNEFFQFKEEEYGIVIDAFSNHGEVIEEFGYTLTSDYEEEE